jgi:hypothetical protein
MNLFTENDILKHTASPNYSLLVYDFANGAWNIYNSKNLLKQNFKKLFVGRGYWVKMEDDTPSVDINNTYMGYIHSSSSLIPARYYKTVNNGWNLLSFNDTQLRHSPTGMFVPNNILISGGIRLYFSKHNKLNYTLSSGDINVSIDGIRIKNTSDVAQVINASSEYDNLLFGKNLRVRAFPAMNKQDVPGVIIISDYPIEVNVTDPSIVGLSGENLEISAEGLKASQYGSRVLGLQLLKASNNIEANLSLVISGENKENSTLITDLNDTNKTMVLTKMSDALDKIDTQSEIFFVQIDFNTTQEYNNTSSDFNQVLMSSKKVFSIKNALYAKAFEVEDTGAFRLIGRKIADNVNGGLSTAQAVVNAINNETSVTGIRALNVGKTGEEVFLITSDLARFDILEKEEVKTIFNDLPLDSGKIREEFKNLASFNSYFTYLDILNTPVLLDTELIESNLSYNRIYNIEVNGSSTNGLIDISKIKTYVNKDFKLNALYVKDFTDNRSIINKFAELNKEITSIIGLKYTAGKDPYWVNLDLTKSPDTWFKNEDKQGLFPILSDKGYFVRLRDTTLLSYEEKKLAKKVEWKLDISPHFDNKYTDGIATTQNHMRNKVSFSFNETFISPLANPYYAVYIDFLNNRYSLKSSTSDFTFTFNDISMVFSTISSKDKPYKFQIQAYDGFGNFYDSDEIPTVEVPFVKPDVPEMDYTETGDVIHKNHDPKQVLTAFSIRPPDIETNRLKAQLNFSQLKYAISWKHPTTSTLDGALQAIRFIVQDQINFLYSDTRAILYAPLKTAHVLEATFDKSTALYPYSFIIHSQLKENYGVSITLLDMSKKRKVKIIYYPEIPRTGTSAGLPSDLSSPTFLRISRHEKTLDEPIATISYKELYVSRKFYISFDGKLYQGTFPPLDQFTSDSNSYDLSSRVMTPSSFINDEAAQSDTLGGIEVDSKTAHTQSVGVSKSAEVSVLPILLSLPRPVPKLKE